MDCINGTLDKIEDMYGKFSSFDAYLFYVTYEVTTKYFGGEASIANNFTIFRTPYLDADIIQLSYEIEYSILGFSKFPKKDQYREKILQTSLVQNNRKFSKIKIGGIPLNLYSNGRKPLYNFYRIVKKGPKKILSLFGKYPHYPLLEDWVCWYKTIINREIDRLISKDSIVCDYLNWEFLEEMKKIKNVHWLGKILTAEIILNLIKNRWRI